MKFSALAVAAVLSSVEAFAPVHRNVAPKVAPLAASNDGNADNKWWIPAVTSMAALGLAGQVAVASVLMPMDSQGTHLVKTYTTASYRYKGADPVGLPIEL